MLMGKLHCRVWKRARVKKVLERIGDQTPGHSHLSPSMCHYFLYSLWHSAGHSWSSRQERNQSTISLLHSLFRSCWLSASGLARNELKIHPWNNKVWVPCKERKIYKTWQLMSECRVCVCVCVWFQLLLFLTVTLRLASVRYATHTCYVWNAVRLLTAWNRSGETTAQPSPWWPGPGEAWQPNTRSLHPCCTKTSLSDEDWLQLFSRLSENKTSTHPKVNATKLRCCCLLLSSECF